MARSKNSGKGAKTAGAYQHPEAKSLLRPDIGVQPQFKLHLVTAAQRGYSFALLAVYSAKFAGRCFQKRAPRPTYALRDAVPKAVSQGL